ncbi:hypothetical protein LCGC14_1240760 [marine sediment metagenome]|uniref:Uncharacterized protein n=1 Tax=marine sediment metagenome TaxID=412755 RepID=A0A0F9LT33_9ZZZZ
MTRELVHDRLTQEPKPGESPELFVEHAIIALWELRIAEQLIWLDHKTYRDAETRALVKEHHGHLSHEALEFLSLLLKDCAAVEQEIRNTSSDNSSYVIRGNRTNKINSGRLLRYLRNKWGFNQTKATRVLRELEDFTHTLLAYAAA